MGRGKNFLLYLVILLVVVTTFAGIVWWTLPVITGKQSEQIPIIPHNSDDKLRVLDPPANASEHNETLEPISAIVEQVGSSVVKITTVKERIFYDFFLGQQQEQVKGQGSGVFIDQEGYILTNNHVVVGADQIIVLWTDRDGKENELTGKVLGRDPVTDLAVVKVEAENPPVAPLGDSDTIQVGDTAIAIGNPYGFSSSVTVGVISAMNRDLPLKEGIELLDLIQTDAAINPGNSGGALFNLDGQVVGINTAMLQGAQGLGFAIPINLARNVAKQLIDHGSVKRPWLGIYGTTINPQLQQEFDFPVDKGVFITQIVSGGPAAQAGLKDEDILVQFNGVMVDGMQQLIKELRKLEVDTKIKIVVLRKEREVELTVTLREHPGQE